MQNEEEISPRMQKLLNRGKAEARKKVVERGIVQFRADEVLMEKLLKLSDEKRVPLGTMVRGWIEQMVEEAENTASPKVEILADQLADALITRWETRNSRFEMQQNSLRELLSRQAETHIVASANIVMSNERRRRHLEVLQYNKELEATV